MKKGTVDTKNHSRGVAFVEFGEHQHALVALRVLNNNPETFGPEHRPIVEFALDNIKTLKLREAKLWTQQRQNDDSQTQDVNMNKNDKSRKRKFNGDIETVRNSRHGEEDGMDNRASDGAANEKRRAKKKQKHNPASEKAEVSLRENSEADVKSSKKNPRGLQVGWKLDGGSSVKGKMAADHMHKSNSSEEGNLRPGKRKMENRRGQKGEKFTKEKKSKKNKDPSGRDVVDKLDMLIEQYRSKFLQQSSNKSDGEKKGSKQLRRWFQS